MDTYTNEDSTSNQSDSSSSSTNLMSRQHSAHGNSSGTNRASTIQSVQYEALTSRDETEQTTKTTGHTTKRSLITKNVGTREKRKRNISSSAVTTTIKREPKSELNDEVCYHFF